MRRRVVVINREGHTTIPAELHRTPTLREGDEITLEVEHGSSRVSPDRVVASRTTGLLTGVGSVLFAEELRAAAAVATAEDVIERMEQSTLDAGP